jgi:hypothetical protein
MKKKVKLVILFRFYIYKQNEIDIKSIRFPRLN